MICPDCGHDNIDGADECEQCQQPLNRLTDPQPETDVEKRLLKNKLRQLVAGRKTPVMVSPGTPVGEVLNLLVDNRIGCVLVADGDELLGIFSERDALLRLGADAANQTEASIAEFMTPNPETLDIDDKIAFALQKMDVGHYRHVPLLEDGRVKAIVSVRDILRYITGDAGAAA